MFAALLLVAIFSSALPFYAEAQGLPPKCDETVVAKIYEYWNKNGGIPQRVIERNIKCTEREIAVMATQDFLEKDITCYVLRHFADSNFIYYKKGDNVTRIRNEIYKEYNGQVFEPLSMGARFEIAQRGNAKLIHLCSRDPKAKAGSNWFMIRGVEGKVTKEGCDAMKELLVSFDCTVTLRTFDEKCPVPNELPLIGSCCG